MKRTSGSPFHPTFGSSPPEFTGRHTVIDEIADALDAGPGAAARGALLTGARGIGKTATLNAVEDMASERGWVVVSETVTTGLVDRLLNERIPTAYALMAAPPGRKVAGVTLPAGMGGLTLSQPAAARTLGLRDSLSRLVGTVQEHGRGGVILTLDEVHGRQGRDDLIQLAVQVQHLMRNDTNVALLAAGLPAAVNDLLNDDVTTFLRRAKRFRLGPLTPLAVADALRVPIESEGRSIEPDALRQAVQATRGYPYLVQIIGDYAWKFAPSDEPIGTVHVSSAIRYAIEDMGQQVHEPALHDLSVRDREFLAAMALDDGPSNISDIARRMGRNLNYTSPYRQRLIAAEMIVPKGKGLVTFALPYLREHLRAQTFDY